MTLAQVAERQRPLARKWAATGDAFPLQVIESFEADPEFKLPGKAEALAREVREMVNVLEAEGGPSDRLLAQRWHAVLDPVEEALVGR
jgi:hypothetical protein